MTGYVRTDTVNNIADGNVISAADLDGEFNAVQAAFNSSTGHTHDGTSAEGAPITKLGPVQDVTISTSVLGVKTTNTVDLGTSSLKFKDFYLAGAASIGGTLGVTGATTLSAALTYGGVTLSNAVTGTGNMVLSASPTLTGTITAAAANFSGAVALTGNATIGDADTDTITQAASYVTGTQLKSAKTATNTLSLAAYDVDGTAYTNLITLTASNTPTLALTSTGVGTINNMSIGATTASTGAFTTLSASSTVTLSGGTINGVAYLDGSKVLTTGSALVFDGTNLGVGIPPSAWATLKALQIGYAGFFGWPSIDYAGVSSNAYYTGSGGIWNYISTNSATRYTQTGGTHAWSTSPSGTAGNAITFTQAMTLDASGNLGVGTTSPTSRLHVSNTSASTNAIAQFTNGTTGTGAGNGLYVGVDTSNEATIFNFYNSALKFGTNGSERARIDSSGALLVNATALGTQTGKLKVVHDTGGQNIATSINSAASNPYGDVISFSGASPNNTSNYFLICADSTTSCFTIWSNGTTSGRSDARLKKNIADATPKLNDICQLQVRNYEWIESENGKKEIGLIAQEVEQVFPGLVITHDLEKDGDDYKEVKYSAFVPILIKAIQEQQALITTLTARITALESA